MMRTPRRLALADLPPGRGADRAALASSAAPRSPSSFAPIGAVFGEWVGAELRPRPPDPPGQRPAARRRGSSPRSSSSRRWRSPCSACSPSQSAASSLGDRKQGMKRPRIPAIAARRRPARARARPRRLRREERGRAPAKREPLSLTLDFYPNPDHAGIYMAQKLGYFEEAGPRRLRSRPPPTRRRRSSRSPPGSTDLAISYEPEVLLAREQGLDVVAVGGARQPAADLDDLAEEIGDQRRRPTCAARRSPPPASPTRTPS